MVRVRVVKSLEIGGVLRDNCQAVCHSEVKVNVIVLASRDHARIRGAYNAMPRLL